MPKKTFEHIKSDWSGDYDVIQGITKAVEGGLAEEGCWKRVGARWRVIAGLFQTPSWPIYFTVLLDHQMVFLLLSKVHSHTPKCTLERKSVVHHGIPEHTPWRNMRQVPQV
jgi:hypothetical protein